MYKTTALMLSLLLTSMPVLADCLAQLDRKTVAEQLSRSIDYLGPLPSDLNCEPLRTIGGLRKHHQTTSHRQRCLCIASVATSGQPRPSLHHRRMRLQKLCAKLSRRRRIRFQTAACFVNKLAKGISTI